MDDYMFKYHLKECRCVKEDTHYLEILNYSDSFYDICEEHIITTDDDFSNFVKRSGVFHPEGVGDNVKLLSGIRLIIQKDAKHPETFESRVVSLPHEQYELMVRQWHLPLQAIEGHSEVGPLFWYGIDQDGEDTYLQIIHRKSDVRKKGRTRGYELMISYSFQTGVTSGYAKGTTSSFIVEAIQHLKSSLQQVGHPLLLPTIVLSYELGPETEERQRKAREWLRRLEHAIAGRDNIEDHETYFTKDGALELDVINLDLYECSCQVLWKRPQAYLENIEQMQQVIALFRFKTSPERWDTAMDRLHMNMNSRLKFYIAKLRGVENYAWTTMERLRVQREMMHHILAQRESKLSLQIAKEQKHLAHKTKRDGTAVKTISLLGAIFLPGTYMASVFSMTFFDFDPNAQSTVAPALWVYFAITVPVTLAIVATWLYFERRRRERTNKEKGEVEDDMRAMERDVMVFMRNRTVGKTSTWTTINSPPIRP